MVNREDIKKSAVDLGIKNGDTVIVHSSYKSFGGVEGGADAVVGGLSDALGEDGTLVFPTLCQKDWEHVYENWHLDAPSDVGYLTNYFRKLPGAKRSNQATHSVAAMGKNADYLTKTHGESGLRYGIFGDTPFAADSPWQKMYEMDAKMVFIGVSLTKCTMRHLTEYIFVEECLNLISTRPDFEEMKEKLFAYHKWEQKGIWVGIDSEYIEDILRKKNHVSSVMCGDAEIKMVSAKEFVETGLDLLRSGVVEVFGLYRYINENPDILKPRLEWLEKTGIYNK